MAILPKVKTPLGQPNYQQMLLSAQQAVKQPLKAGPTKLPKAIVAKVTAQKVTPSAPRLAPSYVPKELSGTISPWMADEMATRVGGQAITTATAANREGSPPRITGQTASYAPPPPYQGLRPASQTNPQINPLNDANTYGSIMSPTTSYGGQKPTVDLADFLKTEASHQQYWVSLDGPPLAHAPTTTYPHGPINTLSTITGGVTGYDTSGSGGGYSGGGGEYGGYGGDGYTPYDRASDIGTYAWRIGL